MADESMSIYALDSNFQLITMAIPYTNLQWTRKYYEAGEFSVQIPITIYDPKWAYIGTPDRPELGMVQKIDTQGETKAYVQVSGFFCEKMLDDKVCYPRYKGDVSHTETAARNIFTAYKKNLPISLGAANSPLLGNRTQSDFSDDQLGTKLFSILETRELSYRVRYNYVQNYLEFIIWQGLDRTQSQSVNGYQVFSSKFGNIADKEVTTDESAYKNYAIVPCNAGDDDVEQNVFYVDFSNGGYRKEIVFNMRSSRPDKDQSMADFQNSVIQEATEKLLSYAKIEDINVDMMAGSGYMESYDLGDKCDVILEDVGISLETRITEIREVFKAGGGHTVTVGLGNKRISNIRRIVNSI